MIAALATLAPLAPAAEWTVEVLHEDSLNAKQFYSLPTPAVNPARDLVAYSKDAKEVVLASLPGFKVWRTFSPPIEPWMKLSPVMRMTFSVDGRTLLVTQHLRDERVRRKDGGRPDRARLYVLPMDKPDAEPVMAAEWDALTRGPFWPDADGFVLADSDGRVFRLDAKDGKWSTRLLADAGKPENSLSDPTRFGQTLLVRRYAPSDNPEVVNHEFYALDLDGRGPVKHVQPRGFTGEPWSITTLDGKTAYVLVQKFQPSAAEVWSMKSEPDGEWTATRVLKVDGKDANVSYIRLLSADRALLAFRRQTKPNDAREYETGFHLVEGLGGKGEPTRRKLPFARPGYCEIEALDADGLTLAVTSPHAGSVEIVALRPPKP